MRQKSWQVIHDPRTDEVSPDKLFAQLSKTFNRSDLFITEELKKVAACYAEVVINDDRIVVDWRNSCTVGQVSKVPRNTKYHDLSSPQT